MRIIITMDLAGEYADGGHPMGITESGYDMLCDLLGQMGDDINVKRDAS